VTPAHVLKKLEAHYTLAQLKAIGQGMKVNVAHRQASRSY